VAQDVEKFFPNWVKQDGYTAPDGQKYKTLELHQIEELEVESIRALKAEDDSLTARVKALEEAPRPVATMNQWSCGRTRDRRGGWAHGAGHGSRPAGSALCAAEPPTT
jgi:hypothetical protein